MATLRSFPSRWTVMMALRSDVHYNRVQLNIQWHLTSSCNNRCKHCYMFDPAMAAIERDEEIHTRDVISILDDLGNFEEKFGYDVRRFHLTGGDPLLRTDWAVIVSELRDRGKDVHMMGNPDTLTEKNIKQLVRLGVRSFQLSLDGLSNTHDDIRGEGSFDLTVRKISLLRESGISANVMFTLFRQNSAELIPLLEHVSQKTEATSFSFDLGCMTGAAATGTLQNLAPDELARLFNAYHQSKRSIERRDFKVHEKSNLHRLQRYANGELSPVVPDTATRLAGCLAGWTGICLLPSGAAMACRRLPIVVGKMPEQSFEEIFLGSELMKRFRRHESFRGCSRCALYSVCRGCRATTYGISGDPFGADPHCFRHETGKPTSATTNLQPSPPLDVSYEEENAFIKENLTFSQRYRGYLRDTDFQAAFFTLLHKPGDNVEFLEDPPGYLKRRRIALNNNEVAWLMFYFSEYRVPIRYDIDEIRPETRFHRPECVQPTVRVEGDRVIAELYNKDISVSADAWDVITRLFASDYFTAGEVLGWDPDFGWHGVRSFLHALLEELVICYAER